MKKKFKIMIFISVSVIVLFIIFITTDSIRAKNNEKPLFAIQTKQYEDGGSKKYVGLFYNVYEVHSLEIRKEWLNEDGTLKEEYKDQAIIEYTKVTSWFSSIDKVKEKNRK